MACDRRLEFPETVWNRLACRGGGALSCLIISAPFQKVISMSLKDIFGVALVCGAVSGPCMAATVDMAMGITYPFQFTTGQIYFSGNVYLTDTNYDGIIDAVDGMRVVYDQPGGRVQWTYEARDGKLHRFSAQVEGVHGPVVYDENLISSYPTFAVADLKDGDKFYADFMLVYTWGEVVLEPDGGHDAGWDGVLLFATGYAGLVPVPVPASGTLLLSVLAGFGLWRTRRSGQA